jgi:membrane protein implicated in regulation of membrane protease activity
MRLSFPELMQGLFYLALVVVLILFAAKAFAILDGIEKRQQQSEHHHEKIIAMADKALEDHTRFLREHQAILDRVPVR